MKQITNIRKAVCTMANELKKEGYTLSQAFRKAWRRIKLSMKIRAVGTTAGNIQERLGFMKQFPVDTMQAELVREPENPFDKNAIKIVVHYVLSIAKLLLVMFREDLQLVWQQSLTQG